MTHIRRHRTSCIALVGLLLLLGAGRVEPAAAVKVTWERDYQDLEVAIQQAASEWRSGDPNGRRFELQSVTTMDEGLVQLVALRNWTDLIITGSAEAYDYYRGGLLTPIESFIQRDQDYFGSVVAEEAQIWGRYGGTGYCLYIGPNWRTRRNPAFVCMPKMARSSAEAWELAKLIVRHAAAVDSDSDAASNLIRKYFTEQDFTTLYRYVLHEDRRQEYTGRRDDWTEADFVRHSKEFVASLQPFLSIGSVNLTGVGVYHCGDPLRRKVDYGGRIVFKEYVVSTGTSGVSQTVSLLEPRRLSILDRSTHITLSFHVQMRNGFPVRRFFHSPLKGFEQWWATSIVRPAYCQ